jgi:hypothetical protein
MEIKTPGGAGGCRVSSAGDSEKRFAKRSLHRDIVFTRSKER